MARKTSYILLAVAILVFLTSCAPAAATGTWVDETVSVDALSYRSYYGTLTQGYTMTVQIEVVSGNDITLYIMDQTNYNSYSSLLSFYYLVRKPDVVSTSFTWEVPSTKTYYFVLDNRDSFTSTSVHLTVTYEAPGEVSTSALPVELIGLVLVIVVVVALIAVVVSRSRKGQTVVVVEPVSKPAAKGTKPLEKGVVETEPGFCPHCGAKTTLGATFCKNCGANLKE